MLTLDVITPQSQGILKLEWLATPTFLLEKVKVVKLGAARDSNIPWQGKFGFNWTDKFEILGIHYDMNNLVDISDSNIYRKLGEIEQLIKIWSTQNLTPYGKVTVIKSLLP